MILVLLLFFRLKVRLCYKPRGLVLADCEPKEINVFPTLHTSRGWLRVPASEAAQQKLTERATGASAKPLARGQGEFDTFYFSTKTRPA